MSGIWRLPVRFVHRSVLHSSQAVEAAQDQRLFHGVIPPEAIEKRYTLSSGPGGQNVQKNATKVEIRFKLSDASWIPQELRESVAVRLRNHVNSKGEVLITSERTRERHLNLADCMDKLRATIYDVEREMNARTTSEEDVTILRERADIAAQRRLEEKRMLSKKKADRQFTI